MKIAVLYPYPLDAGDQFQFNAFRWVATFLAHPPGIDVTVVTCWCNGHPTKDERAIFLPLRGYGWYEMKHEGGAIDISAYQTAAHESDADLMIFTNTRTHFWREGWGMRLFEAFQLYGDYGLYGVCGSYEHCTLRPDWKVNPHMRTAHFATRPAVLRQFPYRVNNREDGHQFENGDWNFMDWYETRGWPVKMVTWDQELDKDEWRQPANAFRKGNQEDMLIWDKYTDLYFLADEAQRRILRAQSDGVKP